MIPHMALRVVFFGNSQSQFSNRHFQALLAAPCDLAGVVDVPSAERDSTHPVHEGSSAFPQAAAQRNVACFEPVQPNQGEFVAKMKNLEPDLFLSVGYPKILRPALLSVPRRLAVNFHASLLPAYRGKHPVFWCLRHGERWSGLTVHVMDPGIDTGDLLYQLRLRTRRDDKVSSLYERIQARSVNLVSQLLADIENDTLVRTPQPREDGSYYSSVTEQNFHLDWTQSAETLRRWIIITPGQCFSLVRGEPLYLMKASAVSRSPQAAPGEIVQINPRSVLVAAGEGLVHLSQIRLPNGYIQSFAAYCRQGGLSPGDTLK